ncbi:MAG: hypothetical protein H0X16_01355 [Chloroflexi bacterium]|nr:hypothetical protein [Chloroflexota bacterium]
MIEVGRAAIVAAVTLAILLAIAARPGGTLVRSTPARVALGVVVGLVAMIIVLESQIDLVPDSLEAPLLTFSAAAVALGCIFVVVRKVVGQ